MLTSFAHAERPLPACQERSQRRARTHLGGHVVQTLDADHKQHLGLSGDIEATLGASIALEADGLLLLRAAMQCTRSATAAAHIQ